MAPKPARAQGPGSADSSTAEAKAIVPATSPYVEPTESMKLHNYLFDAFGPYPITLAAFVAGFHQAMRNPPDWREGFAGYGERYASDFEISAINVTARYTLAEALHQDTLYYSCGCKAVGPAVAPRCGIRSDRAHRRGRAQSFCAFRGDSALHRSINRSLRVVSAPVQRQRRVSHGQLWASVLCGR